jgi:hypothetical protein
MRSAWFIYLKPAGDSEPMGEIYQKLRRERPWRQQVQLPEFESEDARMNRLLFSDVEEEVSCEICGRVFNRNPNPDSQMDEVGRYVEDTIRCFGCDSAVEAICLYISPKLLPPEYRHAIQNAAAVYASALQEQELFPGQFLVYEAAV